MADLLLLGEIEQFLDFAYAHNIGLEFQPSRPLIQNSYKLLPPSVVFLHPAKCAGLDFTNSFVHAAQAYSECSDACRSLPSIRLCGLEYIRSEREISAIDWTALARNPYFLGIHHPSFPVNELLDGGSIRKKCPELIVVGSWRDPVQRFSSLLKYYIQEEVFGLASCDFDWCKVERDYDFVDYLVRFYSDCTDQSCALNDVHVGQALQNLAGLSINPKMGVQSFLSQVKMALFSIWGLPCLVKPVRLNMTEAVQLPDSVTPQIIEQKASLLTSLDVDLADRLSRASGCVFDESNKRNINALLGSVPASGLHPFSVLFLQARSGDSVFFVRRVCKTQDLLLYLHHPVFRRDVSSLSLA